VEGSVFGAIAGGYRILVDELVRQSRVDWTRSAVVSLQHEEGGWMLRDRTGASWRSDGVVIAVPAHRLPDLLATAAPGSAAAARRIPAASIAVMALAVPGDPRLPEQPGVLMASGEPLHAKAITLSSRKWGRRGELEHLRLSFGGFGDDVARIAGDDELLSWATDDVATVFGLRVSPVAVHVQRWIDATPQYLPGHAALVGELRAGLPESLAVAGNYLDGNGVADCIASGNAAAASLLRIDVARRASPALKTTKLNARPDLRRSMRS
jgi:oxygen-dependent protoporphyrinogen oxidase